MVGLPPCLPEEEGSRGDDGEEKEDKGRARGFNITRPIDFGSFRYQMITATGISEDYGCGGGGGNEEEDKEE